jgi:hypothetical protein
VSWFFAVFPENAPAFAFRGQIWTAILPQRDPVREARAG